MYHHFHRRPRADSPPSRRYPPKVTPKPFHHYAPGVETKPRHQTQPETASHAFPCTSSHRRKPACESHAPSPVTVFSACDLLAHHPPSPSVRVFAAGDLFGKRHPFLADGDRRR
ncbi:hypothetical protein DY000_02007997 [Brassica cretica]|uniref:Uncharacterized protein n=1 Tax=Brassica cretica TaxID=69181 RepID=A0ABQ7C5C6_BRACR|nr:hypothetical protein DY000_02007997 [Brassica cretica]